MVQWIERLFRVRTDDPRLPFFEEPERTFLTYRTGYKTWGIYKNNKDGSFVLFSGPGVIWPKRGELVAKCLKAHLRAHISPYPMCQCGIHAMNRMEDVQNPAKDIRRKTFAGEVKLWGTILEYTEGARAEFAYPASITCARCSKCDEYKKLDELIFFSFYSTSRISSIRAFCNKCEMLLPDLPHREKLDRGFLAQIAEEYGIDLAIRGGEGVMEQQIIVHPNDSGVIVIIYPGFKGDINGYNGKYVKIADMLNAMGIGAVVRTSNYPVAGIKYEQSVKDNLRSVIDYSIKNAETICSSKKPTIYLMGVSAGASAVAAVAHEYWHRQDSSVEKILLIAPSADAGLNDVRNGVINYLGEVYITVGASDEVVGAGMPEQFYKFAICARVKKFVVVPNCDHQFRGETNGKIFSKAPLWAFARDDTFPSPDGGLKLYD